LAEVANSLYFIAIFEAPLNAPTGGQAGIERGIQYMNEQDKKNLVAQWACRVRAHVD
jgi:hypothetical protein